MLSETEVSPSGRSEKAIETTVGNLLLDLKKKQKQKHKLEPGDIASLGTVIDFLSLRFFITGYFPQHFTTHLTSPLKHVW